MIDLDVFVLIAQGQLPWQPIIGKISKNDLHSAGWHSETDWSMAVPTKKYSVTIL